MMMETTKMCNNTNDNDVDEEATVDLIMRTLKFINQSLIKPCLR